MTTITIEDIKTEQQILAEMIAKFEAQAKLAASYPITLNLPELKADERYIGAIVSADGSKRHHLILLPGEREKIDWPDAKEWAASIGGELPDRTESALLFATMKDYFEPEWYWTREQPASDSDYAWGQYFNNGLHYNYTTSIKLRARAVRRLPL